MRISNTVYPHSSPLNPSLGFHDTEFKQTFLAEELHQLINMKDISHNIVIKGDITINSSNTPELTH